MYVHIYLFDVSDTVDTAFSAASGAPLLTTPSIEVATIVASDNRPRGTLAIGDLPLVIPGTCDPLLFSLALVAEAPPTLYIDIGMSPCPYTMALTCPASAIVAGKVNDLLPSNYFPTTRCRSPIYPNGVSLFQWLSRTHMPFTVYTCMLVADSNHPSGAGTDPE